MITQVQICHVGWQTNPSQLRQTIDENPAKGHQKGWLADKQSDFGITDFLIKKRNDTYFMGYSRQLSGIKSYSYYHYHISKIVWFLYFFCHVLLMFSHNITETLDFLFLGSIYCCYVLQYTCWNLLTFSSILCCNDFRKRLKPWSFPVKVVT